MRGLVLARIVTPIQESGAGDRVLLRKPELALLSVQAVTVEIRAIALILRVNE